MCPCDESIPGHFVQSSCASHQCSCLRFSFAEHGRFASVSEIYGQPLLAPEIITVFKRKSTSNTQKVLDLCENPTAVDPTATISLVKEKFDFDSDMDTE